MIQAPAWNLLLDIKQELLISNVTGLNVTYKLIRKCSSHMATDCRAFTVDVVHLAEIYLVNMMFRHVNVLSSSGC